MRRWHRVGRSVVAAFGLVAGLLSYASAASAETLEQALTEAYMNNPTLNAQRAALRSIDENVPKALSGYRPTISATGSTGIVAVDTHTKTGKSSDTRRPSSAEVTLEQNLFKGFRTLNETRSAESQVRQARENLRNAEQAVLLNAVTAYMNVLRDEALVELQKQNLQALREQLRATRDRFEVGEVTRTDVALSEASVAAAQSALIQAQSNLATSKAIYRQTIGHDPGKLQPGRPIEHLLPKSINMVLETGLTQHPTILASAYAVDIATLQVKIAEGALLPVLAAQASVSREINSSSDTKRQDDARGIVNLTVPLYQGGAEYAAVRQAKESLGEARIQLDVIRDQVRAQIVQFWTQLDAAKASIEAAQTQVRANQTALNGVTEEYMVGQRTILDVLTARSQLVTAQSNLVTAQRDRVVASFAVLSSFGRLDAETLELQVAVYDPQEHYYQIRDSWFGLRIPDGR
ncbi:MAG: TolC family outer membrane protein [Xanthobacteraceae bacterium]|nr:TolC family outer membrane protein [Xanthobacteraceae bacterium]